MKIVVSSSDVQVGEAIYPLNTLFFQTDGVNIIVSSLGLRSVVATGRYDSFTDSSGTIFGSADAVITALKTSLVTP